MFDEKLIRIGLEGEDRETVIMNLAEVMIAEGRVHKAYVASVLAREEQFPTGLPTVPVGVAIPHALAADDVLEPCIAAATLVKPVPFGQPGTDEPVPVRIIFLLAIKDADQHLELLRRLGKIFTDPDVLSQLVEAHSVFDFIRIAGGIAE